MPEPQTDNYGQLKQEQQMFIHSEHIYVGDDRNAAEIAAPRDYQLHDPFASATEPFTDR